MTESVAYNRTTKRQRLPQKNMPKDSEKNKRPIACQGCRGDTPTMLTAWASDFILEREDVDSIDFIPDDDIYRFAVTDRFDCSIEGGCLPCNGP